MNVVGLGAAAGAGAATGAAATTSGSGSGSGTSTQPVIPIAKIAIHKAEWRIRSSESYSVMNRFKRCSAKATLSYGVPINDRRRRTH
jgi:uncharacterized spore protein YtfJ